jgi:hypothetical protein
VAKALFFSIDDRLSFAIHQNRFWASVKSLHNSIKFMDDFAQVFDAVSCCQAASHLYMASVSSGVA